MDNSSTHNYNDINCSHDSQKEEAERVKFSPRVWASVIILLLQAMEIPIFTELYSMNHLK